MMPRKNSRDEKFRHQKFRDEKFRFFTEMARFISRDGKKWMQGNEGLSL